MAKVRVPKPKILAISLPALLIVAVIGWLAGTWLGDQPRWILWTVRSLIWVFGMLAIALVLRMLKGSGAPPARSEPDPIDGLLEQATKRLNAIGVRGRRALARMPVVLVLGPRGSAKTTFVLRSDLDADLLAGNVPSGEMAAPTDALNLWYREGQVLVEAGGQMSVDPARWARLVEKLKPRQLIPALLGRAQAPRVALVCLSVEDLTGPGTGDSYLAAARTLRARLTELAEGIGIRLPVYVVFTKADRISHFEEFAKNLTDAEVHELLGATLRSSADAATGSYAERESERLSRAMEELFQGLSERRVEVLNRAATTQGNGAAYEFPREFRKVSKPAIQFLVELCRPNQLRVSAFLRGFYFTGVRPIVAQDAMHQPAPQAFTPQVSSSAGATQVFRLEDLQAPSPRVVAPARTGERRIPQWVFLDRILQRVVLMDRVAMGITSSGIGLSVLRRASMAGAIAFFLLFGLVTVIVQRNDARLAAETRGALEGVVELNAVPLGPGSTDQLLRLDSLRAVTAKLAEYEHEGRPWRSKVFMYSGEALFEQSRRAYFHLFRTLLFDRAFQALKLDLRQLPEQPSNDQFDRVYRSLKAYVEITDPLYNDSATAEFFGPVLTERWLGAGNPEPATRDLVQRQFAFYGSELAHESPFSVEASDPNLVNLARAFLGDNTTVDGAYARLLGDWSRLRPGRLEVDRPETVGFLRGGSEVQGAYTRAGWDSVHAALANGSQAFAMHVVGQTFFQTLTTRGFQIDSLSRQLQTRYEQSYRNTWLRYLAETQLEYRDVGQAQSWLEALGGGSRSALIQLFAYVDSQTKGTTPDVQATFAALRTMIGSDSLGQLVIQKPGSDYLVQLQGLALAVGRLPQDPVAAATEVQTVASKGQTFVRETAIGFPTDPPPAREASSAMTALLEMPFQRARELATRGPGLANNMKAQGFCAAWNPLVFQRFPFRRQSTDDVDMADLHALFNPAGELQKFITDIDRSGVTPTPAYSAFKTRARSIADALYENGPAGPGLRMAFQVRTFAGIDRVDVRVDNTTRTFTSSQAGRQTFEWDGTRANQASIVIQAGGRPTPMENGGNWGLFRVFSGARWQDLGSGRYVATWSTGGVNLEADVYFNRAPVLDLDYLGSLACPREVAR